MSQVTKLEDIVLFLEGKFNSLQRYKNKIFYSFDEDDTHRVKDYGVQVNLPEGFYSSEQRKIGKILHETWTLNVNLIINVSAKTGRDALIKSQMISDEIETIKALFLHQFNDGKFKDTIWEPEAPIKSGGSYLVPATLTVEIENTYTS